MKTWELKMCANKIRQSVFIVVVLVLLSSCAASKLDQSLDFSAGSYAPPRAYQGILGVDEFLDLRPQGSTSDAKKWVSFIPGILWLEFITETPDTSTVFSSYDSFPFKTAYARAIYKYMKENNLFEKAVYLPEERYIKTTWRLEGLIKRTTLKETGYYYGSSFYSWFTRIIGLPYVSYEFSLDLTLRLRRLNDDKIIWTYDLKGARRDKYNNVYRLMKGKENKHVLSYNFSKILEEQMPSALNSLKKALEDL